MKLSVKKTKCMRSFNKDWKNDYNWLVETTNSQEARCTICQSVFKIMYMGVVALNNMQIHIATKQRLEPQLPVL